MYIFIPMKSKDFTFTVKKMRIFNGRGHLKLDFYGHFYCYKPVSNGHCKKNA